MGKLAIALAAVVLMGSMAFTANAQTLQTGASSVHGLAQNATSITKAACMGMRGACRPGFHKVCGPARCWCRPC